MNVAETNSFPTQQDAIKFVDDFISVPRDIPDISLLMALERQKKAAVVLEQLVIDDLLLHYAFGKVRPALSVIHGLRWLPAETC